MTMLAAQALLRPFFIAAAGLRIIAAAGLRIFMYFATRGSVASLFFPKRIPVIGLLLYPPDFI